MLPRIISRYLVLSNPILAQKVAKTLGNSWISKEHISEMVRRNPTKLSLVDHRRILGEISFDAANRVQAGNWQRPEEDKIDGIWILEPEKNAEAKTRQEAGNKEEAISGKLLNKNERTGSHLKHRYIGPLGSFTASTLVGVRKRINHMLAQDVWDILLRGGFPNLEGGVDVYTERLISERIKDSDDNVTTVGRQFQLGREAAEAQKRADLSEQPVHYHDTEVLLASKGWMDVMNADQVAIVQDERENWQAAREMLRKSILSLSEKPDAKMDSFYYRLVKLLTAGIDRNFMLTGKTTRRTLDNVELRDISLANIKDTKMPIDLIEKILTKPLETWTLDEIMEFDEKVTDLKTIGYLLWKDQDNTSEQSYTKIINSLLEEMDRYKPLSPKKRTGERDPLVDLTETEEADLGVEVAKQERLTEEGVRGYLSRQLAKSRWFRPMRLFDYLGKAKSTFNGAMYKFFVTDVLDSHEAKQRAYLKREHALYRDIAKHIALRTLKSRLPRKHKATRWLRREFYEEPNRNVSPEKMREPLDYNTDQILHIYAMTLSVEGRTVLEYGPTALSPEMQAKIVESLSDQEKAIALEIIKDNESNYTRVNDKMHELIGDHVARLNGRQVYWNNKSRVGYVATNKDMNDDVQYGLNLLRAGTATQNIRQKAKEITIDEEIELGLFSTWHKKLELDEKFINQYELMDNMRKVHQDERFKQSVITKHGIAFYQAVQYYYERFARGNYRQFDKKLASNPEMLMEFIRKNFAPSVLAYQVSTVTKQIPSLVLFIAEAGVPKMMETIDLLSNPVELAHARKFVEDRDIAMKERQFSREADDLKTRNPNWWDTTRKVIHTPGMVAIGLADKLVTTAGWIAMYEKALDMGMSEGEAIRYARDVVKRSQPSSFIMDVAEIYDTANPFWRGILAFTNQISNINQMLFYDMPRTAARGMALGRGSLADRLAEVKPGTWAATANYAIALGINWIMMHMITFGQMPFVGVTESEDDDILPKIWLRDENLNESLGTILQSFSFWSPFLGKGIASTINGFEPFTTSFDNLWESVNRFAKTNKSRKNRIYLSKLIINMVSGLTGMLPRSASQDVLQLMVLMDENNVTMESLAMLTMGWKERRKTNKTTAFSKRGLLSGTTLGNFLNTNYAEIMKFIEQNYRRTNGS